MPRRVEIPPRMLKKQQAADYCGLSPSAFLRVCPVSLTAMGPGERLARYDIKRLDAWLDTLGPTQATADAGSWRSGPRADQPAARTPRGDPQETSGYVDLGNDTKIEWNR